MRTRCLIVFLLALSTTSLRAAVHGLVVDDLGQPVAHLTITLQSHGEALRTTTGDDGRFAFDASDGTLRIDDARWRAVAMPAAAEMRIALVPATVSDAITVTATRTRSRLGDTPSSLVVIGRDELDESAAATVDDALRQVPGFTLFRRSGSRTANPTSQGVSLRGVGASGASRALVLDDGIPLNDPFGGWIYWGRLPRAALDRIEVLRGGASDLYGSAAMGGVIQFVRRPSDDALAIEASAGSERTADSSLFAAVRRGAWGLSLAGDWLTTAGYLLVDDADRGSVDRNATTRHDAIDATLERRLSSRSGDDGGRAFLHLSRFIESRNNGTQLQMNDTATRQLAAGLDLASLAGGALSLRAYDTHQDYDQTFSSIAADRNSERLTVAQRVPSRAAGGSGQWSRAIGMRNALIAGIELRDVRGASDEQQFAATGALTLLRSSGQQRSSSFFAEDVVNILTNLGITAGARFDSWRNDDAHRETTTPAGAFSDLPLASRADSAWSPRLSLLYKPAERLTLIASAYRAFRAPTLNELYRSFRVGNVSTLANESLGPEHLSAIEAGARVESANGRASFRATLFRMTTDDPIANVTLTTTPALITRQRQNLGRSRSQGAELESDLRLARGWRLSAGYLRANATVVDFAASPDLEGKRLPQVPRDQATLELAHSAVTTAPHDLWNATTLGAQLRVSGLQYDDDQNTLPLAGFTAVDLFASHPIAPGLQITFAIENALDRRYAVAATPIVNLGQPRTARIGLRYAR